MDNSRTPEEILAYCERATEGPWAWIQYAEKENSFALGIAIDKNYKPIEGFTHTEEYDEDANIFVDTIMCKDEIGCSEAAVLNYGDPQFICFARTDLPVLAREVIRLRKELADAREHALQVASETEKRILDDIAAEA